MWARLVRLAAPLALVCALAGCGDGSSEVDEEPLVVATNDRPSPGSGQGGLPQGTVRIAVVTHGQASSPFWAIVRNGVESAARQMDVQVDYRAPDTYSLPRMVALVDQAVRSRPDALVVSLPETGVGPAIRRAVREGIPTVTINSGSDDARKLGVLVHVGQPEDRAGLLAGRRLARSGVRRALCVNQQVGNLGLDARCRGLAQAMREAGGRSFVVPVDDQAPTADDDIRTAIRTRRADGVLAMNATSGIAAAEAVKASGSDVEVGTFDLGPDVLGLVQRGQMAFAVDQQAYLQGYLPIVLLAQRARYGLFPAQEGVLPTGPRFVTREDAGQALELSRRSIR
ncbi:substrate-binding domain-containing protein [Conexibacter sp. SYSU D00693]|uniref:substrate-binding domain-containing protein n=1 Tax=Conexibacter sp. SYSU D00693 TaxID=2812560 RepID=UPI00196A2916|nr:substrate-binding domain-containing protein [Conexibacter sp. SYSU D00693]